MSQLVLHHGDALDVLRRMPDDSVDLVFCSPPYEAQRSYGIGFSLRGQEWVDWAAERFRECYRVSRGLTCWVVEGHTRKFAYSGAPFLLFADLMRGDPDRGSPPLKMRKPPVYQRFGIPGSGGPDFLKNNYEPIICASKGRLPWSDNTAFGHSPKPSGPTVSHHSRDGRVNRKYTPPKRANPGNLINCGAVGGGTMGSRLSAENEAPFPERLPDFFIRSFCPPGGTVLDIFSGSGTTVAAAIKAGRRAVAVDCRVSQCNLTLRRVDEARRHVAQKATTPSRKEQQNNG